MAKTYRLVREQLIPRPPEAVFEFFADASNLERLTPSFLNFRILTALPIAMAPGVHIEYQLKLFGVPLQWLTRIEEYVENRYFVDLQLRGPYKLWRHLHRFEAVREGTRMLDQVDYALPFGPLGSLAHALHVERTLRRIFDFRAERVAALFGRPA